jgi:transcriptional regulator with XRE-family HTH domain
MQDPRKWRELLGKILQDPRERKRLANEMNVSPTTLVRWTHGKSTPRPHNVRLLLKALPPQYHAAFSTLLPAEMQASCDKAAQEDISEIPSFFYRQVLQAHATLPQPLHFSSICDIILLQALTQLDPNHVGMEISIVQCVPPSHGHTVRSLRESMGRGTPPFARELEQRTILLGAESLAGYATTNGRLYTIQSREEGQHLFPAHWVGREESVVACPIMRADTSAGCLLVSSTQPQYFTSPVKCMLVQQYANLLVIAFEHDQFYRRDHINLHPMPPYEVQRPIIAEFRNRVVQLMLQAQREQQGLSITQAEQQIWQQIEYELLQYSFNDTKTQPPEREQEYREGLNGCAPTAPV